MPLVVVNFGKRAVRNLTDRAQRYRANRNAPDGPKQCAFCGSKKQIMVGHLDGHESHNEPENLLWTCRSCNSLHGNALKRARMGKRTAQFNPTASGGASNLGEWVNAVGAIRPRAQGKVKGPVGSSDRNSSLVGSSTMSVSDAVAMIRATPQHKRQEFSAQLGRHRPVGAGRLRFRSDGAFSRSPETRSTVRWAFLLASKGSLGRLGARFSRGADALLRPPGGGCA